jgi:DNA-binding NtrC family response regulator
MDSLIMMKRFRILWIADHASMAAAAARREGFAIEIVSARGNWGEIGGWDAAIVELPLGGVDACSVVAELRAESEDLPVLVHGSFDAAEAGCLKDAGADVVIAGPLEWDQIRCALEDATTVRQKPAGSEPWTRWLVGESAAIRNMRDFVRRAGPRRCTVLISGETGAGKEIVARALHAASPRAGRALVSVCCTALPEQLLESELFGHVKGAFTGALNTRIGRFEKAHGGTLFLDEIGDMPLNLQAKLLRVLQEREFQRVGSSETQRVDVRIVAATNVDLESRIRDGRFREDLYYRLAVAMVRLPPLRERRDDVPRLLEHFIEKTCLAERLPMRTVTPDCLDALCCFPWPGNVRQLEHAVEAAVALSGNRRVLCRQDFPVLELNARTSNSSDASISLPDNGLDFTDTVSQVERSILRQALRRTGGNKKAAADLLRLKRTTLAAKLRSLGEGEPEPAGAVLVN